MALLGRLYFIVLGVIIVIIGLLWWIFRERAGSVNPKHYTPWFGGELRYIGSAEGRIEHTVFKSKVLLACSVPILALGIFATDDFFEWVNIVGISFALMFLSIALKWIFDSDAANRGEYTVEDFYSRAERPIEDISTEELEKAKERD